MSITLGPVLPGDLVATFGSMSVVVFVTLLATSCASEELNILERIIRENGAPWISPYCNKEMPFYCKNHIACFTNKSMPCVTSSLIQQTLANLITTVHNQCRDRSTRVETDKPPGRMMFLPRFGDMPTSAAFMEMDWDEELAALATLWTTACATQEEGKWNNQMFYRQNISRQINEYMSMVYALPSEKIVPEDFCFDVSRFKVRGWKMFIRSGSAVKPFSKWTNLLWGICANATRYTPQYIIESYRRPWESLGTWYPEEGICMLWAKSNRVGCGQLLHGDPDSSKVMFDVFACLYAPAPLKVGHRVYEVGWPGSGCPIQTPAAGVSWPNTCVMDKKLTNMLAILVPFIVGVVLVATAITAFKYL